jgi:hypothetical protein
MVLKMILRGLYVRQDVDEVLTLLPLGKATID